MPEPLVLCYHGVSERWPSSLAVLPDALERQLSLLLRRGYAPTTLSEALSESRGRRTVVVTFDDAFRSVFDLARPILARLGVPGTVFVPTSFAGSDAPMRWPGIDEWLGTEYEDELRCCDWDELSRLGAEGWEIGSHTRTHPRLTTLPDAHLAQELGESRADCEARLGTPCRSLSFPYGDHDERVVAEAGRHYSYACALPQRFHRSRALAWPRVGVYRRDDMARFRLKCSPIALSLRSSPAWPVAERARTIMRRTAEKWG